MCVNELKKSFNQLSPTTGFLVGFIGAVLILCTIGFFVLLGFIMKGKINLESGSLASNNNAANNAIKAANPATAPTAAQGGKNQLTEPAGTVVPISSRDHVRGSGELTLIEYSDFECPYCKNFHETMKQVMEEYKGKIKWAYRHYPLNFHANAQKEAEASECAYELGGHEKFWSFADKIYERTTSNGAGFALADLPKLAGEIGLNKASFTNCLDSGKNKDFVSQQLKDGSAAGVSGTPGTILIDAKGNKEIIKGAYPIDLMKQIIDAALKR